MYYCYKMSQSLASAKKRRVPNEPPSKLQSTPPIPPSNNPSNGLTLPQVIEVVDRRLIQLEKFMNETQKKPEESPLEGSLKEVIDEFDKRYEMLAEEIVNLKNIVINLQSFTMEVNKTMLEERRQWMSQFSHLEQIKEQQSGVSETFAFSSMAESNSEEEETDSEH